MGPISPLLRLELDIPLLDPGDPWCPLTLGLIRPS